MKDLFCNSVFFGVMISILAYELGLFLKKKLTYRSKLQIIIIVQKSLQKYLKKNLQKTIYVKFLKLLI